ncbi:DUF2339 domain-containing protein [Patescibacteria group bacterium]|nr:MAG: DUF2339 domain-containing protein [Patescibacteria group bacterium]
MTETLPGGQEELQKNITAAKQMVAALNAQIADQESRLGKVAEPPVATPVPTVAPPPPPPPPASGVKAISFPAPQSVSPKTSFEEKLVSKFVWIGSFALFLGMTLLMKYAYDNRWIGPWAVAIIGVLTGLVLVGWGISTIRRFFVFGQVLSGLGIAILYLSLWAAFGYYALIPSIIAFGLMALVTAGGMLLSVRYNAIVLFVVSMLGGFLTPVMVSTGENRQLELLSYIAVLDLAILGISFFKKWLWSNLAGILGTIVVFAGWWLQFYTTAQFAPTLFFLTIFFLIYSVSSVAYNLIRRERSNGIEQLLTVFSAITYFPAMYILLDAGYHPYLGLFTVALAAYYFLWAYLVRTRLSEDMSLYSFMAYLGSGFLALAVPIQFDGIVVTIGWAILSAVLLLLGLQVKRQGILFFGTFLFLLTAIKLVIFDLLTADVTGSFLINRLFAAFLMLTVIAYGAAYAFRKLMDEHGIGVFKRSGIASLFLLAGNFIFTIGASRDIAVFYTSDRTILLTLLWLGEALVFLALGALRRRTPMIISGLIVFALAGLQLLGLNDSVEVSKRLLFLNRIFATFTFAILVAYVTALLFRSTLQEEGVSGVRRAKWVSTFLIIANLVTIYGATQEITAYYNNQVIEMRSVQAQSSALAKLEKSTINNQAIVKLQDQKSTAHSLFWILYGILLIVFGLIRKSKTARIGGLILLIFSILKLFFFDLWDLGRLYQIISSISLGVVLIATSFVYLKYKDKIGAHNH